MINCHQILIILTKSNKITVSVMKDRKFVFLPHSYTLVSFSAIYHTVKDRDIVTFPVKYFLSLNYDLGKYIFKYLDFRLKKLNIFFETVKSAIKLSY